MRRHFLFLQGGVSPFFSRLGTRLRDAGHRVSRIHFCSGDRLLWQAPGAIAFRGAPGEFPVTLEAFLLAEQVTDILLFGGCRPLHRQALGLAQALSIRANVLEEGYLRPDWVTLERGGVNGESSLPRDPSWYLRVGAQLPAVSAAPVAGNELLARAQRGLAYQLARLADPVLFPHYRSHRRDPALAELLGWVRRFARLPFRRRRDRALSAELLAAAAPFYLLPLQLNGDAQVTCYSGFADMTALIDRVVGSFARFAPPDSRLLIKNHPLDTGLVDYAAHIRRAATNAEVLGRVHYLETGSLAPLIDAAAGLVTINSTVGLTALIRHCPTIALGRAVYQMPGTTFQGPLERFWTRRTRPDPRLVERFLRTLVYATQLRGNLYTDSGIRLAVQDSERLLATTSPLQQLLMRFPLADTTAAAA